MIGVVADSSEQDVAREFFELFKTPWEFWRRDGQYEVVLCIGDVRFDGAANLVLFYAGRDVHFDYEQKTQTTRQPGHIRSLSYQRNRIPIYGDVVTFPEKEGDLLADEDSGECVAYLDRSQKRGLVRIGYDLLREVRTLLTTGQPTVNANIPTLELHIAFLRDLIIGCGIRLVEIPPVPDGYRFIACLTHDIDNPSIRRHEWDQTATGFLFRAVLGSLRNFVRGRMSIKYVITNWLAALKLPFVYLGFAKDFWREFDDRYLQLEKGLRSTFFVIPFKNRPGKDPRGPAPILRAARYGAQDIVDTIQRLLSAGCEIGLHGIDAWLDSSRGREELEEIQRLTGVSEIGVRMHWLYYDQQSPATLEEAGAAYGSTIGYNETVGYRAGTTQAYKPLQATRLLELPLHVMDTALFFPGYLALSQQQATILIGQFIENAIRFGGCLTINWHDRSLAPERLWDTCYRDLLKELKDRGAWCATAGEVISWFRKRRSVVFESSRIEARMMRANLSADPDNLPGLQLRIHEARGPRDVDAYKSEGNVTGFDET